MKKLFYSFVLISGLIGSSHSNAMVLRSAKKKKETSLKKKRTKKENALQERNILQDDMDIQEASLIHVKKLEDIARFVGKAVAFQTESANFKPTDGYVIPDQEEIYYFGCIKLSRVKDKQGEFIVYQMIRLLKKHDKQLVPCFLDRDALENNELFMRIITRGEGNKIEDALKKQEAVSEEVLISQEVLKGSSEQDDYILI